jgi:hypothetical protein
MSTPPCSWREEGLQVKTRWRGSGPGCPRSSDRGRRTERGVGDRLPVRFHHRRQDHQDRLDDDEHTRESLMKIVERSSPPNASTELETAFTLADGPPKVLRMGNGPKLISYALQQFCENKPAWSTFRRATRGSTAISDPSTTEYHFSVTLRVCTRHAENCRHSAHAREAISGSRATSSRPSG